MKAVTKYQANDLTIWDTAEKAAEVDAVADDVAAISAPLGAEVRSGRRLIEPIAWRNAKREAVMLCRRLFPNEPVFKHYNIDEISPLGYAGRYVSECHFKALRTLWWRFSCVNGDWEYEQPYFAINPEKFDGETVAG